MSEYEYDALNRMTVKSRPGEADILYQYDIAGRLYDVNDLRSISEGGGLTEFDYDGAGRLCWVADRWGRTMCYSYEDQRPGGFSYPDDTVVDYKYDPLGRLARVEYDGAMVAEYEYDALGRRSLVTMGNDANAVYEYDFDNRLTELRHKFNSSKAHRSLKK